MNAGNVGMIERGQHLRFTSETRQPFRIRREGIGKDFQGDVAIQLRIARAIDLAHAASPQKRQDFERSESSSGGKRHWPVRFYATASRLSSERILRRMTTRTTLVIVLTLLAFCRPVASFGQDADGSALYQRNCAQCHDSGVNRAPVRDTFLAMTPERVLAA